MQSEMRLTVVSLLWLILVLPMVCATAQVPSACAEGLIEQSRLANLQPPYAAHGEDYCDGAAAAEHGGRLELRSMTRGPIHFGTERLEIVLERDTTFFVRGWDLRPASSYRLDGDLSDGVVSVGLSAAIGPMGIQADDIGLYAWRKEGISLVYAPVAAGGKGPIYVLLRSPTRLRAIRFATLCPGATDDCGIAVLVRHENSHEDALIRIELPADVEPGRYRLTIVAAATAAGDFPTGSFDLDL